MSDDFRFLLARFPDPDWEERKLTHRLRDHLLKLRQTRREREYDPSGDGLDADLLWDIIDAPASIEQPVRERMQRRARRLACQSASKRAPRSASKSDPFGARVSRPVAA